MGPIGVRKMNALMQSGRIEDAMLLQMVSPQDYGIFPLSRNMAIITMSPAYKQHRHMPQLYLRVWDLGVKIR